MFEQFERAEERYKNTIYAALLEGEERGEARGEERGIKLGEERGIRLGEERGEKAKELAITNIARNALQMGMTISEVSLLTGKSEDEISQLIH